MQPVFVSLSEHTKGVFAMGNYKSLSHTRRERNDLGIGPERIYPPIQLT